MYVVHLAHDWRRRRSWELTVKVGTVLTHPVTAIIVSEPRHCAECVFEPHEPSGESLGEPVSVVWSRRSASDLTVWRYL